MPRFSEHRLQCTAQFTVLNSNAMRTCSIIKQTFAVITNITKKRREHQKMVLFCRKRKKINKRTVWGTKSLLRPELRSCRRESHTQALSSYAWKQHSAMHADLCICKTTRTVEAAGPLTLLCSRKFRGVKIFRGVRGSLDCMYNVSQIPFKFKVVMNLVAVRFC